MPSNYPGNATAVQAPGAAPGSGVAPILSLPADGDPDNAATFAQAFKECADYIAYIQSKISLGTPPVGDTPQARFYDTAGNLRWLVDHNGFPMGRRSEVREEWIHNIGTVAATATPIVPMQRWSTTFTGAGGALTLTAPSSSYPANAPTIITTGGACGIFLYTAAPLIHTGNTFLSTVVEWEAGSPTNVSSGTHSETIWMGLTDNPAAPASSNNYCWFSCTNGQVNWQCANANGGAVTTVDSTVSESVFTSPGQRMRIELHGSASPYAGKARFFINEALVQTSATNLPASAALSFMVGSSGAASSVPVTLRIGPVLATWPRQLSLAAL